LHAVAQTLRVEQDGEIKEYRFTETGFEQRSDAELAAGVFTPDQHLNPIPSRPLLAPALPGRVVPDVAELQLEVLNRLDRVNALLQEQIRVKRISNGTLSVEGAVEDQARKAELLDALRGVAPSAAVHVAVSSPADSNRQPLNVQPQRLIVQSVEAQEQSDAAGVLRAYLARRTGLQGDALDQEVTRFSNSLIERSVNAQLHATVLRQISADVTLAALSPAAVELWTTLIKRHAESIRAELASVRHDLSDVFRVPATEDKAGVTNMSQAITTLAELTAAVNEGLGQSFAMSTRSAGPPAIAAPPFWEVLRRAEILSSAVAHGEVQP
jgi:hypothetical protein